MTRISLVKDCGRHGEDVVLSVETARNLDFLHFFPRWHFKAKGGFDRFLFCDGSKRSNQTASCANTGQESRSTHATPGSPLR